MFETKPPRDTNAFSSQLKKLYRNITTLETKILREDSDDGEDNRDSQVVMRGGLDAAGNDAEKTRWMKIIDDHKMYVLPFLLPLGILTVCRLCYERLYIFPRTFVYLLFT